MAEDGRLARIASQSGSAPEQSLADLLDPIALEERLKEARARRAEALARRDAPAPETSVDLAPVSSTPEPAPFVPSVLRAPPRAVPPLAAAPASALPPAAAPRFLAERANPAPAPAQTPAPRRLVSPLLVFLAGLGIGGAVVSVLALQALSGRDVPAAETAFAPAAAIAPVAAPAADPEPVATLPPPAAAPVSPAAPATPAPDADGPLASAEPEPVAPAAGPPPPDLPAPPATEAVPPTPAALPARVFIHFPPSAAANANEAAAALRAAGVGTVEIVPVRYAIGRSNIRFYHDSDRAPAAALAPLVALTLEGPAPEARDFTDYATPTAPGSVEVWLAGTAGSGGTRATATRRTASTPRTPAAPFQIPGVIAPVPTQEQQVERILIERLTNESR